MTHRTALEAIPESSWFKSSYSENNGTACVEVAALTATPHASVAIRDSKDPDGPALLVPPEAFAAFVAHQRGRGVRGW